MRTELLKEGKEDLSKGKMFQSQYLSTKGTLNKQRDNKKCHHIPVPFFSIQFPWLEVPSPSFSNPNVEMN